MNLYHYALILCLSLGSTALQSMLTDNQINYIAELLNTENFTDSDAIEWIRLEKETKEKRKALQKQSADLSNLRQQDHNKSDESK